ncbi:transposase [Sulfurimonas sp. SAG-AH-194-C21]|nr:transposase [Sulfurimonas sp. SAG-AH-194-C21]MDF1884559.1 transposase [Sulfurimonas sp. SAG-AH-194-C21]
MRVQRNSREDNKTIKDRNVPESFKESQAKLSQKDTDARWMTKSGERHYGYKDHINADAKTKLITEYSAYRSKKIEESLKEKDITSHVHEKGYRNNPLDVQQKLTNKMKSKIRVRVEHVFGYMTNSMNDALHMTSIGIKRIESNIGFLNQTYNLFRYEQLVRLGKVKMI